MLPLLFLKAAGLGKMRPNIVTLGYKRDWQAAAPQSLEDYVGILQYALCRHLVAPCASLSQAVVSCCCVPISGEPEGGTTAVSCLLPPSSDAFDFKHGVCLLRLREGLNVSRVPQAHSKCCRYAVVGTTLVMGIGTLKPGQDVPVLLSLRS